VVPRENVSRIIWILISIVLMRSADSDIIDESG